MNKHQQSLPFLLDMEKVFLTDRWFVLLTNIRQQILNCYKVLKNSKKILKYSLLLSSSSFLSEDQRKVYFKSAVDECQNFNSEEPFLIKMEEIFPIQEVKLKTPSLIVANSKVDVILTLNSNLLESICCKRLSFGLKFEPLHEVNSDSLEGNFSSKDVHCPHSNRSNLVVRPIFETYHTSSEVGIKCPNLNQCFRRSEQRSSFQKDQSIQDFNYEHCFTGDNITIQSGTNQCLLTFELLECGYYTFDALYLEWIDGISFIQQTLSSHVCFSVISEEPSLKLSSFNSPQHLTLFSGINQNVIIQFNSGSYFFPAQTNLTLKSSNDLLIGLPPTSSSQEIIFTNKLTLNTSSPLSPFQHFDIPLIILGSFSDQRGPSGLEHELTVSYINSITKETQIISLSIYLIPPFMSTFKLHSANKRKFFEIAVTGLIEEKFVLHDQALEIDEQMQDKVFAKSLSPFGKSIILKNQIIYYIWELLKGDQNSCDLSFVFLVKYYQTVNDKAESQLYKCSFNLKNFDTLYTIRVKIDPRGSEFCRVGSLANLSIIIEQVGTSQVPPAIMYETIVDTTLWNISGRTAGVIETKDQDKFLLTFEALPLISGLLPIPSIRLFKYVSSKKQDNVDAETAFNSTEANPVEFEKGQIYNWNRGSQVNVLPSSGLIIS